MKCLFLKPLIKTIKLSTFEKGPPYKETDLLLTHILSTMDHFLKYFSFPILGDIGKQDADGFLYIVDRLKELIKYKAFQVAPASLEDILLRHDAVADVGVIGVPDVEAGELPRAYVVKKHGRAISEKELQDFVSGNIHYVTPLICNVLRFKGL